MSPSLSSPSLIPCILPVWMNGTSLNPWLSDFHVALFPDGSGCYLFWDLVVILSMIAQGDETCLHMPSPWLEVCVYILVSCVQSNVQRSVICIKVFIYVFTIKWYLSISLVFVSHYQKIFSEPNNITKQSTSTSKTINIWIQTKTKLSVKTLSFNSAPPSTRHSPHCWG